MQVVKRLLVFRLGALGDVVLALPAIAALRRLWPGAHICWVGYPANLEWLEGTPYLDSWQSVDSSLFCHLFDGQKEDRLAGFLKLFDYCVAWVHDRDGHVARLMSECYGDRCVLAPPFPVRGSGLHATDHLLAGLSRLAPMPAQACSLQETLRGNARPFDRGACKAVIHPGSGSPLKCWSLERFQAVAISLQRSLGLDIHWLLGPADSHLEPDLRSFCLRYNMKCSVELPICQIKDLLAGARLYVGNDSGITHLAAAVGTPTFALFGPTSPAEWAPSGPHVSIFWRGVACSPCSESEMKTCPHRRCLAEISPEEVVHQTLAKMHIVTAEASYGH